MKKLHKLLHEIAQDSTGVSIVEFALVSPVLMLTLVGVFDLGFVMYTEAQLQGAIQSAARSSTIQGADNTAVDKKVTEAVEDIVSNATVAITRRSYTNFADVSQPEDYTDTDGDGICNNGEPFEDANGNGTWDEDRGKLGNGGARDAVLYTVEVSYPRAFPLHKFAPVSDVYSTKAQTVLRNQPYSLQKTSNLVGNCA